MSYVLSNVRVRKILSKCLTLIAVLLVFASLFVGIADACQNECDAADHGTCSCVCHCFVATNPETAVSLYTDCAVHLSGNPHFYARLSGTDIFRPPIV